MGGDSYGSVGRSLHCRMQGRGNDSHSLHVCEMFHSPMKNCDLKTLLPQSVARRPYVADENEPAAKRNKQIAGCEIICYLYYMWNIFTG